MPDTVLTLHSTLRREDSQRTMGQTNKDCRSRNFTLTNSLRQQHLLVGNWGMYLFTFSYGSYAVDQRSGHGWVSGWSEIFAFYQRNSWFRLWVARRENCPSTEQNHPKYLLQEKGQSGGNECSKEDRFLRGRQIAYLIYEYFRSLEPMVLSRIMESFLQLFFKKWQYSGVRFEMGRNSIINDANPIWWHLGIFVQFRNTRVWEAQDHMWIVQYGDSSEESRTW